MNKTLLHKLERQFPLIRPMAHYQEIFWINPKSGDDSRKPRTVDMSKMEEVSQRLIRFAPYIADTFPETRENGGMIESPLVEIPAAKQAIEEKIGLPVGNRLFVKLDSQLPVSGSVKARGGIYAVLKLAEDLALKHGILRPSQDYRYLEEFPAKQLFSHYTINVGSTGNLGLSIGIIGTALGFKVRVHTARDTKEWKKELLLSKGIQIAEYSGDYLDAVAHGKAMANATMHNFFIDDENSSDLFLGYAVAGRGLAGQLSQAGVCVDGKHPLFIYLPCVMGSAPSGIISGIKMIFGKNAHCLLLEPTQTPCTALGMLTGMYDKINVSDIGLDGIALEDGLAINMPSALSCQMLEPLIDGCFTVSDLDFYRYLTLLIDTEDLYLEPSACGALAAFRHILASSQYLSMYHIADTLPDATHIIWSTGSSLMPRDEMQCYYEMGKCSGGLW